MSRRLSIILLSGCIALGACVSTPKPVTDVVLPATDGLQAAVSQQTEQWYQAEWFWQGRSIAFLMMMRPESDGSHTLLATTLTGQELFAVQERQGSFTVLQQLPETRRIPLPYVFRDVAWAKASATAFAAMQQPEHQFQADDHSKTWRNSKQVLWQARLQDDGAWLIDNAAAHYQLRLLPIANDDGDAANTNSEVTP
ncbi:DUF3261 domain-containing protein [Vitreoscilla massiliensis]|uniref:DUF3261 domain-containing protein n=1 Tax=Vitreoscilla massiliensis TaxID=1689272 RepID=A0ABY4E6N3_9NEIS|nr:DUF3261 domain-containing protein [Vitreoscilla massiliensis]UOO90033.1 DUF3261 domain-containing protein [Vitreoscilla massiliensis]